MSMTLVQRFSLLLVVSLTLGACATSNRAGYDYSAFVAAQPASVLILPPTNVSPDVKATYGMLAQMTKPLAEAGYYVVPVGLMDSAFKENGVHNADEAQSISTKRLREIFGADAALYTEITEYGSSYQLVRAETAVAARARLVDLRTDTILWEGSARASSAEQQNSNNGGGLVGLLVEAAVTHIANNLSDKSYEIAGMTSQRLLSPGANGILIGPRSPLYGKDRAKK
jgi:hypothetical protein